MKTTLNLISSKLPAAAPAISCWLSSNYTHNPTLTLPSIYTSLTISDFNPHEIFASDGDAS